ncbi:hypothetical protein DIDNDMLP_00554 [Klebsiella phage KP13-7]|uniref:Putative regulatory protein FmdB zinc ribbon domain-containing protein n=1 Tax=Klebsiella phage vB_KleM_RaK2 TaxID=1147094 RepID=H6X3R0_9CAUD|nr:hypothetical protein F403_gp432 [Klebsiella phage vB_KleM_RaK2]YP_010843018.1 zinc ribbon domain-containing protein [Klebsiella phage K64-1]AFA44376.1 hypothetical protein RaK2_00103 [Klebsiella phage vB_KleM_RaK2]QOE32513.1 putative RNA polymerase sigma factor [Klebsiella phage Muenster]UYL05539.1 hypothetical protein DIDNDMLP_00554 [Klebsiella phage KP13-7]
MPIYTYRCSTENCTNVEDKIVKYSERENPKDCKVCGSEKSMHFENFTPGDKGAAFNYKGNWLNTTGRY